MEAITVNGRAYQPVRLLGKGKGGYSWLVTDGEGEYVLKQIHHEPCSYYTFGDKLASELRDYERLSALGIPMPKLLDADREGERILKEYIPGETVDRLVLRDALPQFCWPQIEAICTVLYRAGLNIDYYPTNFIPWEDRLYYVDYECNGYMEQWDFEHWGSQYWWKSQAFQKAFGGAVPKTD